MIGDARTTFTGNVSQAPELRITPGGSAVCNFSVAVSGRRKDDTGKYVDGPTSFYRVTVWRELAENVAQSIGKGDRVFVAGDLSIKEYEKDGVKGRSVEVEADEVGPSLRFATATVKRATRVADSPAALAGAGAAPF